MILGELIQFVRENQRGNGFKDWTFEQLIQNFDRGLDEQTLYYSVDKNGNVNGVVLGKLNSENKTIFVEGILSTGSGILTQFAKKVHQIYPDYNLIANRRDKIVEYDTPRLKQKLHAI